MAIYVSKQLLAATVLLNWSLSSVFLGLKEGADQGCVRQLSKVGQFSPVFHLELGDLKRTVLKDLALGKHSTSYSSFPAFSYNFRNGVSYCSQTAWFFHLRASRAKSVYVVFGNAQQSNRDIKDS